VESKQSDNEKIYGDRIMSINSAKTILEELIKDQKA
jgi:hypothetical protein